MFQSGDNVTVRWQFRLEICHIYKNVGTISIVHCIRTFVKRESDKVRREFTTSDRIRQGCLSLANCPSTKKPRQLLH